MTQEDLNNIINNSEFSDCISDAAPYRIKIIKDYTPEMKEIQNKYIETLIDADYENVSNIMNKLKLDKKDEIAKGEYALWKKNAMNVFKMTLKTIHPNEGQTPSIGMIYAAGKMLNYIGRNDLVNSVLEDKSITISFSKLEDSFEKMKNDNIRVVMTELFKNADECQGKICSAADAIKKDIYERLPTSLIFDSKNNKKGLKPSHFATLVKHKAMGVIKDSDKYTKYISAQIDGTNANIEREEVILGKTKQM